MNEVPLDADFSIELGREDPVLDFPWTDPSGKLAYVDLKHYPELLASVEEAQTFSELRDLLRTLNSPRSTVETAKCDAWLTTDLSAEDDIFHASHKFASYIDVVLSDADARLSLPRHELFARKLVELLRRAPEIPSAVEICVRRCYFGKTNNVHDGFYFTLYVSGYGNDESSACQNWAVGLNLAGNAIMQLSSRPLA
ncbi:MAG: hypothetical protein WBW53_07740 [Terriglobales bacterium]